jgi:outer membrane PBP1 activator LpoA protein
MTIQWRLSLATGIISAVIAGCAPAPSKQPTGSYSGEQQVRQTVEQLLREAEQSAPIKAAELKVRAANILIDIDRREAALTILSGVDLSLLPPSLRYSVAESRARAALDQNQPDEALRLLATAPDARYTPSPEQTLQFGTLRAEAYRLQNNPLQEALELITLSSQQRDADTLQELHNLIWQALRKLSAEELMRLSLQTGNTYYEQGWFELALIHKQASGLDALNRAQNEWNTLWASHPALNVPPVASTSVSAEAISTEHVLVLLPLQGDLARAGTAIKEGIMAAHYTALNEGQTAAKVSFVDSTVVDSPDKLLSVINAQQPGIVIGPLEKDYVSQLNTTAALSIPVLALNYDLDTPLSQIYQFGLSNEDEARQVAEKAWQDGKRSVLILSADTAWGSRIQEAFTETFTGLGGRVADSKLFGAQENFSQEVSALVATDKSQARAKQISALSRQKVQFEERRRKDVDAVFLAALPADARQLKPILAFHYAGDLPIYATSHIFSGTADDKLDRDLNGIRFVDTPWALTTASDSKRAILQLRTDADTRFGRLYALGIDAYRLYPYLYQLQANPGSAVQGETGSLSVTEQKRVYRTLQWAQFVEGTPTPR